MDPSGRLKPRPLNNQLTGTIPFEFLKFDSLTLNVVGNDIEGFGDGICDSGSIGDWMNGLVEMYGCDAILCPVGTWTDSGRQEEEETPCEECEGSTYAFMGATTCASEEGPVETDGEELEILAEFYLALGGQQWEGDLSGWEMFAEMESPEDLTLPSYQYQGENGIDQCKFLGVVCEGGKVVSIKLANTGLEGLVPSSLWDLPMLKEIDLAGNEVRLARDYGFGDIANAKSLEKVDLTSNDIQKFMGWGRTGNNLIEFLHALQNATDTPSAMVGVVMGSWVTALITQMWMAVPTGGPGISNDDTTLIVAE